MTAINQKQKKWTDIEDTIIKENYSSTHAKKLLLLLPDRTANSIRIRARYLSVPGKIYSPRLYSINSNYFEVPNLQNCYWAGFIAADGCIYQRYNSKILSIGLQASDLCHLERFKNDTEFEGKISSSKPKIKDKEYFCRKIEIHDDKICDDLTNNFKITQRKSLVLQPPNLIGNLALAYICGYSDGDGSMMWRTVEDCLNHKSFKWSFAGTYDVLNWCKNILDIHFQYKNNIQICKTGNICTFSYNGYKAIEMCKELHKLDLPYLKRKWDKIYEY